MDGGNAARRARWSTGSKGRMELGSRNGGPRKPVSGARRRVSPSVATQLTPEQAPGNTLAAIVRVLESI
jgi:hypothetical protein